MRKFRKCFFGYSPAEVDEFFADLKQQKKTLVHNKKKTLMTEIEHIENLLEKYREDELTMMDSLTLKLTANEGIVQQAREKSQVIKCEALRNLQANEERLCELQKLLQGVCNNLEQIKEVLQDVNQSRRPLAIVAKGGVR